MRKVLLSMVLLASVSLVFAQNYSLKSFPINNEALKNVNGVRGNATDNNPDFESWSSDFASLFGEFPVGWFMITGNKDGQKITDAQNGNFAMHVESNKVNIPMMGLVDTLMTGQAVIGRVVGMGISQGEEFTQRPESISFHCKGEMLNQDTSIVVVQLKKNGSVIAEALGFYGAGDLTSEWQQKTINFYYQDNNDLVPDSISMLVTSGGVGIFQGVNIGTLTLGSYIDFDNMSFQMFSSVESDEMQNVSVYPNPANDMVTVENVSDASISILNMLGQEIITKKADSNREVLDVSMLVDGTYIIRIESAKGVYTQKLNIVR